MCIRDRYSTVHIKVWVEKEACPLNLAPTSSTTAALVMGDALAVALMEVRKFRPGDFAHFHPGGELGKRLLTTAPVSYTHLKGISMDQFGIQQSLKSALFP